MSSNCLRIGVAGLGKMGLLHAATFNSLCGCQVVAAADPGPLVRSALAEMMPQVRAFADVDEMLEAGGLDAVVITTPVGLHVPVALSCVERGLPFFVEKPLAVSAGQAETLVLRLRERPTTNMVGFMTRYIDAFQRGREIVRSECLGRLQRVTATIYVSQLFTRGTGWRYERKTAGGGVLLSQGSHLLDLLTWCFGAVGRVNAEVHSVYSEEVEDFAHVMIEFESGLRAWMDCSWSVRHKRTVQTTIEVLGDNGALVLSDDDVRLCLDDPAGGMAAGWTIFTAPDLYRSVRFDVGGPQYTREDQAFVAALRDGAAAEPDVMQALHVQRIVDAAYASANKRGAPVTVAA
jgi:predicted dehydrogenase